MVHVSLTSAMCCMITAQTSVMISQFFIGVNIYFRFLHLLYDVISNVVRYYRFLPVDTRRQDEDKKDSNGDDGHDAYEGTHSVIVLRKRKFTITTTKTTRIAYYLSVNITSIYSRSSFSNPSSVAATK